MSVWSGTRLDGRYRLTDRLADAGTGMGQVWRAMDEVRRRHVAVKILRPELTEDEAFRRRFQAAARVAGGLEHPRIAAIHDYGEIRVDSDDHRPQPEQTHLPSRRRPWCPATGQFVETPHYLAPELLLGQDLTRAPLDAAQEESSAFSPGRTSSL